MRQFNHNRKMTGLPAIDEFVKDNNIWILTFSDDVTVSLPSKVWLVETLKDAVRAQIQSLVIDLKATETIDSHWLKFLLDIQQECSAMNIQVVLQNPNHHLRHLFRIMQFDRMFLIDSKNQ